jgi:hypothetical protein
MLRTKQERKSHARMNSDANLIFAPLGTFEGEPTEGGQADAPKQSHVHHRFLFTKPLRILQLDGK